MTRDHIIRTNGIILKSKNYLESSLLVTLFSEDYGKINAIAKGYRKPKSQFGSSLDLFTISEIIIYNKPTRELQVITQAEILKKFNFTLDNIQFFAYASGITELFDKLVITQDTSSKEANQPLFSLLTNFLTVIELIPPEKLKIIFLAYEMRLASLLGYMPNLQICSNCQKHIDDNIFYFDTSEGGVLHQNCNLKGTKGSEILINKGITKIMETLIAGKLSILSKLKINQDVILKLETIIDRFLKSNVSGYTSLKSLNFLEKINGAV